LIGCISCGMKLDLIPVPAAIPSVRARLDQADELGGPELVSVLRSTLELINIRKRLLGYALTVGDWPALN
jgi:hypothetical protein